MNHQKKIAAEVIREIDKRFNKTEITYQTMVREGAIEKPIPQGSDALFAGYHISLENGLVVLFLYLKNRGEMGNRIEAEFMMPGIELKSLIKREEEGMEMFAERIQERIKEAEFKTLFNGV